MVQAYLREKKGLYYIAIYYYDDNHERKQIWVSTKLKVRGNKRKAEELLLDYQQHYDVSRKELVYEEKQTIKPPINTGIIKVTNEVYVEDDGEDPLFGDYIEQWNDELKDTLRVTTYSNYVRQIQRVIKPYFNGKGITLHSITANDIKLFYKEQLKKVSACTIRKYHANIRKCLQEAFEEDKINTNPADKVKLPKGEIFVGGYYNKEELKKLIQMTKGKLLEFPVVMASYYGLRRSEIAGLKWSAVDFNYKTITIMHTAVYCPVDGKAQVICRDNTKTSKSMRTLPLMPIVEEMLLKMKAEQEERKKFFKSCYNDSGYIYVIEDGTPVNPDYITKAFIKFIKANKLKHIRFHDLRHSCATLMRHEGVKLEDIQKWLGHSQISTTEKIYAHFSEDQHKNSAMLISNCLGE